MKGVIFVLALLILAMALNMGITAAKFEEHCITIVLYNADRMAHGWRDFIKAPVRPVTGITPKGTMQQIVDRYERDRNACKIEE